MVQAALLLLVLGGPADDLYLRKRLTELTNGYEDLANRQSVQSLRARAAIVREIGHLPYSDAMRVHAVKLLARILHTDRSYTMRVDAAMALGAMGTPRGLDQLYRGLFGADAQTERYALLHTVLADALARMRDPKGLAWVGREVLQPAIMRKKTDYTRMAGAHRWTLVAHTLDGVSRAGAVSLQPEIELLAASPLARIRRAALRALIQLKLSPPVVKKATADEDWRVRLIAARATTHDTAVWIKLLADEHIAVRRTAIRTLGQGDAKGIPLLIARLTDEKELRYELNEALVRLTGKDFGEDQGLWRSWWAARREQFQRAHDPLQAGAGRPYFFNVRLKTRRAIFLIDVSASMASADGRKATRMERATAELKRAIGQLEVSTRVRVYAFASEVRDFPGTAARAQQPRIAKWLDRLVPSGATNTYGALMRALNDPFNADTIILLSDGSPTPGTFDGKTYGRPEQILAEVARVNELRGVRIHSVAFSAGMLHKGEARTGGGQFLRRLAKNNAGTFREVR